MLVLSRDLFFLVLRPVGVVSTCLPTLILSSEPLTPFMASQRAIRVHRRLITAMTSTRKQGESVSGDEYPVSPYHVITTVAFVPSPARMLTLYGRREEPPHYPAKPARAVSLSLIRPMRARHPPRGPPPTRTRGGRLSCPRTVAARDGEGSLQLCRVLCIGWRSLLVSAISFAGA